MPSSSLIHINSDPTKGDTYEQYYLQYHSSNPGDYPGANNGNFSQREFTLLKQYHGLTTIGEKFSFLKAHPELSNDPREQYLRDNPEENAKLAIFGQAKIYSEEAYDLAVDGIKELDIPDNAVDLKWDAPTKVTELKGNWQTEDFIYNEYNNESLPDYIENDDARTEARNKFLDSNPEYRDDRRRIDAYQYDENVQDDIVELYVEYFRLPAGSKRTAFRASHPDLYQWGIDAGIWKAQSSGTTNQVPYNTQTFTIEK